MKHFKRKRLQSFMIGLATAAVVGISAPAAVFADHRSYDDDDDDSSDSAGVAITFIHSGDFHGDYHPHTNGRGDASGRLEGGIARGLTVINDIRDDNDNVIHVHTGDTIHGSGEASITKGMALVKLVDQLGIDVSTPGNWEFAYTPYRYMQFFGVHDGAGNNQDIESFAVAHPGQPSPVKYTPAEEGTVDSFGTPFRTVKYVESYNADGSPNMAEGVNRWGMVAANVYQNGSWRLNPGVKSKGTGMNLTPPYRIVERDGVKVGFIGCTTNRGPQVVSSTITSGVSFSNCKGGIKFPQNRPVDWDDEAISHTKWEVNKGPAHWQKGNKWTGNPASAEVQAGNRVVSGDPWTKRPQNNGTAGYKVKNEIVRWTNYLRDVEGVDLVAVMSEAGIAENVYAAENLGGMADGPDIYFSSDMHEEANFPVVTEDPNGKKVIIIENPEDIVQISQLNIVYNKNSKKVMSWSFEGHDVDDTIAEDVDLADMVAEVDADIADMIDDGVAHNPYSGHRITAQLTDVVGQMEDMVLERNRFTNEFDPANKKMPGLVEGTGHDLVTDMFRNMTKADVGGIRGFRYTNSVLAGGDITYKALYHFFPIGPQVAVGSIPTTPTSENGGNFLDPSDPDKFSNKGSVNPTQFVAFPRSLQQEMELAGNSTMNPNIPKWGGGWFWNYSGIKFDLMTSGPQFDKWGTMPNARVSNITFYDNLNGKADGEALSDAHKAKVTYASYYYHEDYNRINRNQLVPRGKCADKKVTPACVDAVGDILILAKEARTGDYVLVDNLEYDAHIAQHNSTGDGKLEVLDTVEALARYISDEDIKVCHWDAPAIKTNCHTVEGWGGEVEADDFEFPRANLVKADGTDGNDLTDCTAEFGFPCIQQIRGSEAGLGIHTSLPGTYNSGPAETPALSGGALKP